MKLPRRPERGNKRSGEIVSFVTRRRNNSHTKNAFSLSQEDIRKQTLDTVVYNLGKAQVPMKKHQTITGVAAFVLLAAAATAAATTLRSPSPSAHLPIAPAGILSLKELSVDVNKLPIEDFDDQSLVFSTRTKR
jgi:hypothetical protein